MAFASTERKLFRSEAVDGRPERQLKLFAVSGRVVLGDIESRPGVERFAVQIPAAVVTPPDVEQAARC